jgi:hypothetical protein
VLENVSFRNLWLCLIIAPITLWIDAVPASASAVPASVSHEGIFGLFHAAQPMDPALQQKRPTSIFDLFSNQRKISPVGDEHRFSKRRLTAQPRRLAPERAGASRIAKIRESLSEPTAAEMERREPPTMNMNKEIIEKPAIAPSPKQAKVAVLPKPTLPSSHKRATKMAMLPLAPTTRVTPELPQFSCEEARTIITKYAFDSVVAKSCAGEVYSFAARRSGNPYGVKISAVTGELIEVKKGAIPVATQVSE